MLAPVPVVDLSLPHVERRLAEHRPSDIADPALARAAVACVLRYQTMAPEVLLMQRAERPGDRWSGQVSFPGGREDPRDPELRATAVRETREEMGIDLDRSARLLGRLDTIRAVARGGVRPLTITPFVYLQTEPMVPCLNHEAVYAFWLPLDRAARGELSSHYEYRLGDQLEQFPCWRHDGQVIWGMTFHMLRQLLRVVS